jgi:hypothetical protein
MLFQTRFYYDIDDDMHFVILHPTKKLLTYREVSAGHVHRSWLLQRFKNAIQILRLTHRSCLVEYALTPFPVEKHRVYVW